MRHFPLVVFVCLGIALAAGAAAANLAPVLADDSPLAARDVHLAPHPDPGGYRLRLSMPELSPHPDPGGYGMPDLQMAPHPDPHGTRLRIGASEVHMAPHPDPNG